MHLRHKHHNASPSYRLLFHYIRLGFHMLCRDTNTGHRSLFKINWRCSDFLFSSVQCFLEKVCKQFIANSCSSKKLKHKKWLLFRESRSPVIDTQPQRRAQKSLKSDWSTSHTPRYQDWPIRLNFHQLFKISKRETSWSGPRVILCDSQGNVRDARRK